MHTAPPPIAMDATDVDSLRPLVHLFLERVRSQAESIAFDVYPPGAGAATSTITWRAWGDEARAVAAALLTSGVAPGDRVAVLARNRPLWPVADMAIQMIGAIGVGIYPTSAPVQVESLLRDSGARVVLVDSLAHAAVVQSTFTRTGNAGLVVCDIADADWTASMHGHSASPRLAHYDAWRAEGAARLASDADLQWQLEQRTKSITIDALAALIYTSGSTGEPKGACISHRYLAASAASIASALSLTAADRTLSFLPFSHAAERVFGQSTRILLGMRSALIEDPADVFRVASVFQPTFLGGLPRLFERLYEAADVARRDGRDPHDAITERIGTHCRMATSGGAALPRRVAEELNSLGLPILGAYGQTEHLCVAMNRPAQLRFDTVGTPMSGTVVRLAHDGELLVQRSALTFDGYWQQPEATRVAFTADGVWLRTGDRADVEASGALRITGRVKELIALSNGRKIAPIPIEAALAASPFIAHGVLFGEGRKYLVALLSLRRDVVEAWARQEQIDATWPALAHDALLRGRLQDAMDTVNSTLARTDRVQAFAVTADEFSQESGELTPTLKLLRIAITTRFADTFDRLYTGSSV